MCVYKERKRSVCTCIHTYVRKPGRKLHSQWAQVHQYKKIFDTINTCIRTSVYTYIHTYIHKNTHTLVYMSLRKLCVHVYTNTHIQDLRILMLYVYTHLYTIMHSNAYIHTLCLACTRIHFTNVHRFCLSV